MNRQISAIILVAAIIFSTQLVSCSRSKPSQNNVKPGPQILVVIKRDSNPAIFPLSQSLKSSFKESRTENKGFTSIMEFDGGEIAVTIKDGKAIVKTDFECVIYLEKLRRVESIQHEKTVAIN